MNEIKPSFPTIAQIKLDIAERNLLQYEYTVYLIATRYANSIRQTRYEAEAMLLTLCKAEIEAKGYLLKVDGTIIDVTSSFELPKKDARSFFKRLIDSFNSLI